jgi:hypothetical protein
MTGRVAGAPATRAAAARSRIDALHRAQVGSRHGGIARAPDVPLLHRSFEQKPRARSVGPHVEHRPVGVIPRRAVRRPNSVFVDQLEPPEDVAAEMRVVEHLDVEGRGAPLEEQLEQRLGVRLPRRILLALASNAARTVYRAAPAM